MPNIHFLSKKYPPKSTRTKKVINKMAKNGKKWGKVVIFYLFLLFETL